MAKKVIIVPFGRLPCGSKFTSTSGSALLNWHMIVSIITKIILL